MPDIIIVEDNKEIGTLLCDFLRKENYAVSLADTGERLSTQMRWLSIKMNEEAAHAARM